MRMPMLVRPGLRWAALLEVWLLLLGGVGLASSPRLEIKDLKQPVAAGSPTTYADLLQLVFPAQPEAHQEATAESKTAPARHIDGDYQEQPLTAKKDFGGVSVLPLKGRNQPLLLLRVSATGKDVAEEGEGGERHYDLLALCQTGPTPRLLELVDIGSPVNQLNGFWTENPVINLTSATQVCMIYQEHFNSEQSYLTIRLLWVRNQRLEEVLSVSPFSSKGLCEPFTSKAVFWTVPDKGQEYPRVVAKLTVKMEPSPEDCEMRQRGFTSSYQGVWQWEPAKQKYQRVAGDLDQLYKWYEKYY